MKNLLKVIAISSLFFTVSPSSAQVTWGVNVHVGNYPPPPPPPREVVVERPYYLPDVVWVPGYYVYNPYAAQYMWMRGSWQHRPLGARWIHPAYYGEHGYAHGRDRNDDHKHGRWQEGHWQ
jgi:hypothetical protein